MWIRNKGTNSIQEIHNADVVKLCKKDPEKYELSEEMILAEEKPVKDGVRISKEALPDKENREEEDHTEKEEEKVPLYSGRERAVEVAEQSAESHKNSADLAAELSEKSVADLRVIAKEKGIQGYGNMNKETMIAVIMSH